MTRLATISALAISFLFVSGCRDSDLDTYPVRGIVRFPDGKLLRQGSIEFESIGTEEPVLARAEIQPDGSFVLGTLELDDGAVAGKHRAVVISSHMIGNGPERPGMIPESPLDPKYSKFRTAGLDYVVEPKTNNIVIEVDYAPSRKEQEKGAKSSR